MRIPLKKGHFVLVLLLLSSPIHAGDDHVYKKPKDFLTEVFKEAVPKPALIWLTGELKKQTKKILGHRYQALRMRYWRQDTRSVWILNEIGKDRPITIGFVINKGHIEQSQVLIFRESRGWEIRREAFTQQFKGAMLNGRLLDRRIDGISGATLSVNAMERLARLALYLDQQVQGE